LPDRLSNLLGALALAVVDAQEDRLRAASGLGPSAAAAVNTLAESPGETVAGLATVLELTHSATVRLVDDLERRGLLARRPGTDRRSVALHLTKQGMALRTAMVDARAQALAGTLADLGPAEREALDGLVTALLRRLTTGRQVADHICRLCDEAACGREDCPVERRAVELGA
jgi:DNA-binding MarR family transcriptional regulator